MKRFLPFFLFAMSGLFLTACQKPTDDEKIKQEYEQLIEWQKDISLINSITESSYLRDGECKNPRLNDPKRGVEYCHLLSMDYEDPLDSLNALYQYKILIHQKFSELDEISTTTPLMKNYRDKMRKALVERFHDRELALSSRVISYNTEQREKITKEYTDAFISVYEFVCGKFNYCTLDLYILDLAYSDGSSRIFEFANKYAEKRKEK